MPRSGSRVRVPFFAHFLKAGYYPAFFIAYGDGDELLGEHYRKIVGNFEIRHYKNKNYWDLHTFGNTIFGYGPKFRNFVAL